MEFAFSDNNIQDLKTFTQNLKKTVAEKVDHCLHIQNANIFAFVSIKNE